MGRNSEKKQLPMVDSTEMPESLDCTTCLLPMQYQKKVDGKFLPVGEEDFAAAIKTPEGYVVILVDDGGYTKAQTKPLEKEEAAKIFKKIRDTGIEEYSGSDISIWTERNPTVQNEF